MYLASWSVSGEFAVIRYATLVNVHTCTDACTDINTCTSIHPCMTEYDTFINDCAQTPFNIIKYDPYHYYKTGASRLLNDDFVVELIKAAAEVRRSCDTAAIQQQMPDFIVYKTLETVIGQPAAMPTNSVLLQCYAEVRRHMRHKVTRFGVDIVGDMYHDKFYARNMLRIEFIYALQQYVGNLKLAQKLLISPIGGLIVGVVGDKYKVAIWAEENIESRIMREKLYQIKDVDANARDLNYFLIELE
jgi:hypothetical protein